MNDLIDNNLIEDVEEIEDCLGTFECEFVNGTHFAQSKTAHDRRFYAHPEAQKVP